MKEEKIDKKINSLAKKIKLPTPKNKKIIESKKMSVHIKDYKAPSVLGDENRFFTGELNKEKKRLFFE